jgi:23S rRNA (cytidine1920-2'-O)/16S rRNA (cytidine1409-2'-O)-methyltransferase
MVQRKLVATRSQAENYIKLGYVEVDGSTVEKPGLPIADSNEIKLKIEDQYVSRAAFKLASVADKLKLNFRNRTVLDVGSSTGGFSDFALRGGAKKIIAVDVGVNQLHPKLRIDKRVELHERTDIRRVQSLTSAPDIVLIDVSFISLRDVLPAVADLAGRESLIVAMCKPQFEAGQKDAHKGVVKNDAIRRRILRDFEEWLKVGFAILAKADSGVAGGKGNLERFYLLRSISNV